jgi:two-component system response regulator PilR (NtrC family)
LAILHNATLVDEKAFRETVAALDPAPEEGNSGETLAGVEEQHIREVLEATRGNKTRAAELLGISFRSIRYRLAKHGLDAGDSIDSEDGVESGASAGAGSER